MIHFICLTIRATHEILAFVLGSSHFNILFYHTKFHLHGMDIEESCLRENLVSFLPHTQIPLDAHCLLAEQGLSQGKLGLASDMQPVIQS